MASNSPAQGDPERICHQEGRQLPEGKNEGDGNYGALSQDDFPYHDSRLRENSEVVINLPL